VSEPRHVLVIANETVVSSRLIDLIEQHAGKGSVLVTVVAPVNQPRQGYVVYYDTRKAAARRRLDKTLAKLQMDGVHASGVVVETDPVSALRDAIHQLEPDDVIVSTHPRQKSGWLRGNAVEQMRRVAGDLPFEHIVVDLAEEHGPANVLVVANETVLGEPLLDRVRARAAASPAEFLILSPQGGGHGSAADAEKRLLRAVTRLRSEGLEVHGQVAHPDPYTAVMHAIEDERVDELIVSTFPTARSGWMRRHLVERLLADTKLPVDHIVVDMPADVPA
jgi:hypothetical protein